MNPYETPNGRDKHSANTYAIGNRTYGGSGGVSHATFGQVDPSGYVQREQNKRTGLAASMMHGGSPHNEQGPQLRPQLVQSLTSNHPYAVLARELLARRAGR